MNALKLQTIVPILLSLIVLVFCGCKTIQKLPGSKTTGGHTYIKRCSTCHAVPHPSRLKYRHWKDKIVVMKKGEMPVITAQEKAAVLSYMKNHSGKGKKTYLLRCGNCHIAPDVEMLRSEEWENRIAVLDGNMPVFSEEERLQVVGYLDTYAKKGMFESEASSTETVGMQFPKLRKYPPSFSLSDIEGNQFSLNDTKDKAVIIHFWATWCRSCIEELPALESTWKEFGRKNIQVIGVVSGKDSVSAVRDFVSKQKLTFPMLVDSSGETLQSYLVKALPTTYIIGKDGKIESRVSGAINWREEKIVQYLQGIVGE
ncbi:MAG: redoxin domain-containing protein [Planctomycetes bacterium]|nr:redoxin domain-containing protein [Planctomycetota bacterium]